MDGLLQPSSGCARSGTAPYSQPLLTSEKERGGGAGVCVCWVAGDVSL